MENKDNCKHKKAPTSYHIQDPNIVFKELNLRPGGIFLDIGCGAGDYAVHAAKIIGSFGRVYALDKQEELIIAFEERIKKLGVKNIEVKISDITEKLPIKDKSIDVCLIATVLHAIDFDKYKANIFKEIHRVLKPSGCLAIIECNKNNLSFGPPVNMRLDSEEIEKSAKECGFKKFNFTDFGFNYLIQFEK